MKWLLSLIIFLAACGTLPTNAPSTSSDEVASSVSEPETTQEEVVWEDLRIQRLMPGYMAFPAIEPFLPDNFIALPHPDRRRWGGLFWGTKETLEEFFQSGDDCRVTSPMLYVEISSGVGQKQDGSFTCEDTAYDDFIAGGCLDVKIDKLKWGEHPILSASCTHDGVKMHIAWVGLNYEGHVLLMRFFDEFNQKTPSKDESQVWTDFLTKSRPLGEHDFYKSHGQDLREGFTLVNVYGSVLKVSAEKRIKDRKIQISIQPADHTISCKCLGVDQMAMPAQWHFSEPIVKIQAEVQVSSTANILSRQTITVLLKEVMEFSHREKANEVGGIRCREFNNTSVLNFCDKDIVNSPAGNCPEILDN